MKVVNSISEIYNIQRPLLEKLKAQADKSIRAKKNESWHYYSRIKSEESFALKLETGRIKEPSQLEDFFACTLVVENINEIKNAVAFIEGLFNIKYRRPKNDDFTHKESSSFQFDDLRLYVSTKRVDYIPQGALPDIIFEIQIKTFLQHAWSIATHDLIYKSDNVSWSKERVAYQVKAMLEQAEISISGADGLSKLPELAKNSFESKTLNEIKTFLLEVFPKESLPSDLLRLSRIIGDILKAFELQLPDLKSIIDNESALNKGAKTLDLSPYGIIIQSIINQQPALFEEAFKTNTKMRLKGIFVPPEISINAIKIEDDSKVVRITKENKRPEET